MALLSTEDSLLPNAIASAELSADAIVLALQQEEQPMELAGLAILAGLRACPAQDRLWELMDDDSLSAQCACWALAQLPNSQAFVEARLDSAAIDQREQAYSCLAYIVAQKMQSPQLEAFLIERVHKELERVKQGKTGLGEHACRVLAMLGSAHSEEAIKRVTNEDQYSDRFELQRLRKAIADKGKDQESLNNLKQSWTNIFAEHFARETPAAATPSNEPKPSTKNTAAAPSPQEIADESFGDAPADSDGIEGDTPQEMTPIDWETFLLSPEAAIINEQSKSLISQLGPMFEQLSAQALGKNFVDLNAQEVVAMVLQVLPQAIPPEYMQTALSPQSINGLQALTRYLATAGLATFGDELENGVRQIRAHIQRQIRASGGLHGSDYDEPDFGPQVSDQTDSSHNI